MVNPKVKTLLLFATGVTSATYHEDRSTTECSTTTATSEWVACTSTEITITETQTISQTVPPITLSETSTVKSGAVLNTTQTATSSALKGRDYRGWNSDWNTNSAETWTGWEFCHPSTFTKTVIEYITSTIVPSATTEIIVKTQPAVTLSCSEGCKLDVTATKLIYPTSVIHVTVPITVDALPEPHTPEALTWEYNGVILTYPTTYLLYTELSHAFLATTSFALATTCPTASGSLTLPSPTNYAPLIYPQQETSGPDLPPSALISYLNGQETVLIQLSGTPIGSSCDPVGGGIVEPVPVTGPAQVVYTSTYILAQPTSTTSTIVAVAPVKTTSATETLVVITGSTSTSTSTSSEVVTTTATPTFASTGTTTVVLLTSSSAPAVVTVSVADAPSKPRTIQVECFALAVVATFFAFL